MNLRLRDKSIVDRVQKNTARARAADGARRTGQDPEIYGRHVLPRPVPAPRIHSLGAADNPQAPRDHTRR